MPQSFPIMDQRYGARARKSKSRCFQDHVPRCHLHKSAEFPAVSGAHRHHDRGNISVLRLHPAPSSKKPRQNRVLRRNRASAGWRIASQHRVSIVETSLPVTQTAISKRFARYFALIQPLSFIKWTAAVAIFAHNWKIFLKCESCVMDEYRYKSSINFWQIKIV